ncbi:type II secretion system protein [Candidatus Saccharibacteria bacterium]|nr:type II secretion system protein [Candidatus Saccharibacteria bacterium]
MKKQGFTIIEVALVLVIAGLIFAATFIALPNLWASERDSERKENMVSFVTQLKNYQSNNNRGALPGATASLDGCTAATDRSPSDKTRLDGGSYIQINGECVNDDRKKGEDDRIIMDTSWAGFYRDFMNDQFMDPAGYSYDLYVTNCESRTSAIKTTEVCNANELANLDNADGREVDYTIYVAVGASCDGALPVKSANARKVAVVYRLERAGQFCYGS